MGRELKRKQAKREGKNVREVQKQNENKPLSPKVFTMILVGMLAFFICLYIITGVFITKDLKWFNNSGNANVNEGANIENKILAVDSLRQMEEEYYVYFYDTSKEEDSEVSNLISSSSLKVYRVDLNDAFNSNFVGEPSGIVSSIENLKVSNPTVIKVSSEKIVAFFDGKDDIKIGLQVGQ